MKSKRSARGCILSLLVAFFLVVECGEVGNARASALPAPAVEVNNAVVQTGDLEETTIEDTTEELLSYEDVKRAVDKYMDGWEPVVDGSTISEYVSPYTFVSSENITCILEAKERAHHLRAVVFFPDDAQNYIPDFDEKDLPKLINLVCELYADVSVNDFDGLWESVELNSFFEWHKGAGDNDLRVYLTSAPRILTISINRRFFTDELSVNGIKNLLWGDQAVSLEEHISPIDDISQGIARPIRSCYVVKGQLEDIKGLENRDFRQYIGNAVIINDIPYLLPQAGIYRTATITDASGKVDILMRPNSMSEKELTELKYFLVYEYETDEGRAFCLLRAARSNPGE